MPEDAHANPAQNRPRADFTAIPATACRLGGGVVEVGDNGEDAKSAPVRLLARSARPIEHWFWGNVVHDLSGMLGRERGAIDYAHDEKEIIGYYSHREVTPDGLVLSGALVPWKESDRATEIQYKLAQGVPYEASINFGGDGIKLEQVPDGQTVQVNGFDFAGPGIVVREWPLRGVAVCPYGADANTETSVLANGQTFAAELVTNPNESQEADTMADETTDPVVDEAPAEATELAAVEAPEAAPETEPEPENTPPAPDAEDTDAPAVLTMGADEVAMMRDEFGADITLDVLIDGGGYGDAMARHYAQLKAENAELAARVQARAQDGETDPVEFNEAEPEPEAALAGEVERMEKRGIPHAQAVFMAKSKAERAGK